MIHQLTILKNPSTLKSHSRSLMAIWMENQEKHSFQKMQQVSEKYYNLNINSDDIDIFDTNKKARPALKNGAQEKLR